MEPRIDLRAEGSRIHRLPRVFVNKQGEAILIRTLTEAISQGLIDMYLAYEPRNSFQGLPPIDDKACVAWAQHMIGNGINLVALSYMEGVVGHTALFPIDDKSSEVLVVVAPEFQNTGIGTQLTRFVVQLAYEVGFEKLWLGVEARNARARHVYRKCGFEYIPGEDSRELEMSLDLQRYHDAVHVDVSTIMNREVISIGESESCRAATALILTKRVASLPVLDDHGELIGILTESDLMLPSNLDRLVQDVLTRDVLVVREECTVANVIRLFQSRRVRCIPVVSGEMHLIGVVGRKDVLAYYDRLF